MARPLARVTCPTQTPVGPGLCWSLGFPGHSSARQLSVQRNDHSGAATFSKQAISVVLTSSYSPAGVFPLCTGPWRGEWPLEIKALRGGR